VWDDHVAMIRNKLGALLLALGVSACVESGPEVQKLEDARRALDRKDVEIRAYQWQLAVVGQSLREAQQRGDARERELVAQVQQLVAERATLAERLKKAETDLASMSAALPSESTGKGGREDTRANAEALRRIIIAADARNAQIVEELARIARQLGARSPAGAGEAVTKGPSPAQDVVDPWGFGSRK
jgi:hypothetical protein